MTFHNSYGDLRGDFHGEAVEVAIIIRRKDGSETQAAVMHDATVSLITDTETPESDWLFAPVGTTIRSLDTIHQMRITSMTGYTLYDKSFFDTRKGIESGFGN